MIILKGVCQHSPCDWMFVLLPSARSMYTSVANNTGTIILLSFISNAHKGDRPYV